MDIAMRFTQGTMQTDISLDGSDLSVDHDLETAITLSLFCDRRADDDDPLEPNESRRGWWAETYFTNQNDKFGSKLWLLRREKQLDSVLQRAKQYCIDATKWLVEDKVASSVTIETEIVGKKTDGILGIKVTVVRASGAKSFRYQYAWEQL